MIKLNRPDKPFQLTEELQKELTQQYIEKGENVWSKSFIKSALLNMTHNKCAYCECKLDEESKYMEVEHFFPKGDYPELVVEWTNLLPSCKRCNVNKLKHDPKEEPIIDPVKDNPTHHIKMSSYWLKGKDIKGKMTIDVLNLNQIDRLFHPRAIIGACTHETIEKLLERAEELSSDNGTRKKRRLMNGTTQLLQEAQPASEYSATVATILFTCDDFYVLKEELEKNKMWSSEHQELFDSAREIVLSEPLQKHTTIA